MSPHPEEIGRVALLSLNSLINFGTTVFPDLPPDSNRGQSVGWHLACRAAVNVRRLPCLGNTGKLIKALNSSVTFADDPHEVRFTVAIQRRISSNLRASSHLSILPARVVARINAQDYVPCLKARITRGTHRQPFNPLGFFLVGTSRSRGKVRPVGGPGGTSLSGGWVEIFPIRIPCPPQE